MGGSFVVDDRVRNAAVILPIIANPGAGRG
jgi:hypothetical protein